MRVRFKNTPNAHFFACLSRIQSASNNRLPELDPSTKHAWRI